NGTPHMRVIATAGHVDHGKTTLVAALTGHNPDRWAEEHRRGLTIDLGYAWTTLPTGHTISFVDVPGHQRFIGNMLAGIGPAPAVMLIIAADEGWREQTTEHLDAINALGITHGIIVITRTDLADPTPTITDTRAHLTDTGLANAPIITCSARTGTGLNQLRAALATLCDTLPAPTTNSRIRLWIDRVFTIHGAGTIATGTLESGTITIGDTLTAHTPTSHHTTTVRGIQTLETDRDTVPAVARIALNLRGLTTTDLHRGDLLLTPHTWHTTTTTDIRLHPINNTTELPEYLMAHVGTHAAQVRIRPLDHTTARLTWPHPLPLATGDRLVLRDPGRRAITAGATILDTDPPPLTRRGAARALGATDTDITTNNPHLIHTCGLLICPTQWDTWITRLTETVNHAIDTLKLTDGYLHIPGRGPNLGAAEPGLAHIEHRLATHPFAAPERDELTANHLSPKHIAAAVRLGRLIDLGDNIVLTPRAPALAMRELATLPQPFTTSQARQKLGTTRRVIIPLLEELDRRGWTRRIDAGHREIIRGNNR
ncbi:selenocysteine-specific translation elongation factor, partial [Dermatophilus congolensis]|uniref:selenocysteine-specific translation elongation factor n=1 Tax=Dermatophilus congolensis TaxID=1863 RepID=UPI001AB0365F